MIHGLPADPAWAGKGTTVSVNGRRVRGEIAPGFFPVRRAWKTGDKIELEIGQPVRYEPVDAQTPTRSPCCAVRRSCSRCRQTQPKLPRRQLTSAKIERADGGWVARAGTGDIPLRPFGESATEVYQTYWEVTV